MKTVALLDTNVIVDLLRNYPDALQWLSEQPILGITHIVWFEVFEGARNTNEQRKTLQMLRRFELVPMVSEDLEWAKQHMLKYHLRNNVGMIDCLIASVNYRLQLPLYARNLKHFRPLLGELAQQPY